MKKFFGLVCVIVLFSACGVQKPVEEVKTPNTKKVEEVKLIPISQVPSEEPVTEENNILNWNFAAIPTESVDGINPLVPTYGVYFKGEKVKEVIFPSETNLYKVVGPYNNKFYFLLTHFQGGGMFSAQTSMNDEGGSVYSFDISSREVSQVTKGCCYNPALGSTSSSAEIVTTGSTGDEITYFPNLRLFNLETQENKIFPLKDEMMEKVYPSTDEHGKSFQGYDMGKFIFSQDHSQVAFESRGVYDENRELVTYTINVFDFKKNEIVFTRTLQKDSPGLTYALKLNALIDNRLSWEYSMKDSFGTNEIYTQTYEEQF